MPATEPTKTCRPCNGKGGWITDTRQGMHAIDECPDCHGQGIVSHDYVYDPGDDPYAPDNYKEWEGIA